MSSQETKRDSTQNELTDEKAAANASSQEPEVDNYPHGLKLFAIVVAVALAVFLVALDQTIVATAIPRITDHFNSVGDIGWYGSAYFLTATSLQPTFGRVYKTFSVKGTFLLAVGVFELGSLICGVSPSSKSLIIGRAIAGIGVGGIFSGALIIAAHCLPLHKRPLVFGLLGSMWGVASVAGPLLGGVFTDHVSWRWCFYINLPIGAVSACVIIFILRIPRQSNTAGQSLLTRIKELDLIGASVLIPTIICLLLALQWGGSTYRWNDSRIIGLFVGFGCLLVLFIFTQFKLGEQATLPPRILTQRTVLSGVLYSVVFGGSFFVLVFYLPLYFQSIKGSSATKSGIEVLPLLLSTVILSVVSGAVLTVVGYYTPFVIVGTIIFAIGAGLITTYSIDMPFGKWFGYQVLAGAVGVGFQIPLIAVQTVLPLEDVPVGTACVVFFQTLGGALFISIAQNVFQNGVIRGVHKFAPGLDPQVLLQAGATEIRSVLARKGLEDQLPGALRAYMEGLADSFKVAAACAAAAAVVSFFFEWRSTKDEEAQSRKKVVMEMGIAAA